jgi:hypothetical protein
MKSYIALYILVLLTTELYQFNRDTRDVVCDTIAGYFAVSWWILLSVYLMGLEVYEKIK